MSVENFENTEKIKGLCIGQKKSLCTGQKKKKKNYVHRTMDQNYELGTRTPNSTKLGC